MQQVLANLLLEHAPLEALVDRKVDWDVAGQGEALPFVVMFTVSGMTDYSMSGATGYVMTRVQFDSRGATAAEARSVADALSERLSGFSGVYSGIRFHGCFQQSQRTRHDHDDTLSWFTDSRDFTIHWAPA